MKQTIISIVVVCLFISACGPSMPRTGIVVAKHEVTDLPRVVDDSGYKYTCGIDWEGDFSCGMRYVNDTKTYYDRPGYVLVLRNCDSDPCQEWRAEVSVDEYRSYREGDVYPNTDENSTR